MPAWPWIVISLTALVVIVLAFVWLRSKGHPARLTPMAAVAFACILVGMTFESRSVAYPLFAVGVLLAIADLALQRRRAA